MVSRYYRRIPFRPASSGLELTWSSARVSVWVAILTGAALVWLPFGALGTLNHELVLWANCGILVYLASHAIRLCRRHRQCPWLHPVGLIVTLYAVRYGLGSLLVYYWDALPWESSLVNREVMVTAGIKDNIANSCQLLTLGGLGLYLGLLAVSIRWDKLARRFRVLRDSATLRASVSIYVPILAVIAVLASSLPIYLQGTVRSLASPMYSMIFLVAFWLFADAAKGKMKWTCLLVLLCMPAVIPGVRNGMRGDFIIPLLMIFGGFIFAKRRLPRTGAVVATLLLVLLLAPMLTLYKEAMSAQRAAGAEMSSSIALADVSSGLGELTIRDRVELFTASFLGRMTGSLPAIFTQYYPNIHPFLAGKSFAIEVEEFVPRLLWPAKPNIGGELNEYSRQAGIISPSDTTTSAVFDFVSEYYVNFGLLGVFVLSAVHGLYLRALYTFLHRSAPASVATAIFMSTIVTNPDWFGVVQTAAADVRNVSMSLLILFLLGYPRGRPRAIQHRVISQLQIRRGQGSEVVS